MVTKRYILGVEQWDYVFVDTLTLPDWTQTDQKPETAARLADLRIDGVTHDHYEFRSIEEGWVAGLCTYEVWLAPSMEVMPPVGFGESMDGLDLLYEHGDGLAGVVLCWDGSKEDYSFNDDSEIELNNERKE